MKLWKNAIIIVLIGSFSAGATFGEGIDITESSQEDSARTLSDEILRMDRLLFNTAFNKCRIEIWEKILPDNFEFYDDRTGLNTSKDVERLAFKDRCSKKMKVTRQLVDTEVHVLGSFGAVQLGTHDFYVDGNRVERARFIHIWKAIGNDWIINRIVSFDHKAFE